MNNLLEESGREFTILAFYVLVFSLSDILWLEVNHLISINMVGNPGSREGGRVFQKIWKNLWNIYPPKFPPLFLSSPSLRTTTEQGVKPGPAGMQTWNNLQPEWSTFEKPENEIFPAAKFCQLRGGGNRFSESSHVSVCSLNSIISFSDSQSVMFFFDACDVWVFLSMGVCARLMF